MVDMNDNLAQELVSRKHTMVLLPFVYGLGLTCWVGNAPVV